MCDDGINWEGDLGKVDTAAKENENQNDTMTKGNMKIELDHSDQTAETGGDISQTVSVARWIVYFQGALLGVVAATFFIFGMMVGSLTQSKQNGATQIDCQVSGRVMFSGASGERPDVGAVVLLLPRDARPEKRLDGRSVNPASFEPLENPVIDFVHAAGGAIVRADDQGRFEVYVKAPATYCLLVVSRKQSKATEHQLTKGEMAAISSYFSPVESLLSDREYFFEIRSLDTAEAKLGTIQL